MRLLTTLTDGGNPRELAELFHNNGIPIEISGSTTPFSDKVTVWVAIDSQFDEAKLLLLNPTYIVKNPVNVDKFFREKMALQSSLNNKIYRWIKAAGIFGALFVLGVYIFLTNN